MTNTIFIHTYISFVGWIKEVCSFVTCLVLSWHTLLYYEDFGDRLQKISFASKTPPLVPFHFVITHHFYCLTCNHRPLGLLRYNPDVEEPVMLIQACELSAFGFFQRGEMQYSMVFAHLHLLISSFTHSLIHPFIHLLICLFAHSLIRLLHFMHRVCT